MLCVCVCEQGFDQMILAAQSGLPVDMSQVGTVWLVHVCLSHHPSLACQWRVLVLCGGKIEIKKIYIQVYIKAPWIWNYIQIGMDDLVYDYD